MLALLTVPGPVAVLSLVLVMWPVTDFSMAAMSEEGLRELFHPLPLPLQSRCLSLQPLHFSAQSFYSELL